MDEKRVAVTARWKYLALVLITIAIGLVVHFHGSALSPAMRDAAGDALWATMIAWWMGALAPGARLAMRGPIAYAICVLVELSQLYHAPTLDALRETSIGHLVLGSGFDVRDLVAYAVGVAVAVALEAIVTRHTGTPRPAGSKS